MGMSFTAGSKAIRFGSYSQYSGFVEQIVKAFPATGEAVLRPIFGRQSWDPSDTAIVGMCVREAVDKDQLDGYDQEDYELVLEFAAFLQEAARNGRVVEGG